MSSRRELQLSLVRRAAPANTTALGTAQAPLILGVPHAALHPCSSGDAILLLAGSKIYGCLAVRPAGVYRRRKHDGAREQQQASAGEVRPRRLASLDERASINARGDEA